MEKPLVSVNICTHNRAELIVKAIESVLEQDYLNLEIVIADNGDDYTESKINKIIEDNPAWQEKIQYYKNDTQGISENRNFSLQKSNGRYIAVLDSDDYWISPQKISRQIDFLEQNPEYALIGTNAIIVNSEDQKIGEIKNLENNDKITKKFLMKNHFVHSSVVFKKEGFPKYNEEIFIWEDYDAFLKIARTERVANLPEPMTAYKKHSGNISKYKKIRGVLTLEKIIKENKEYYPNYFKARFKNMGRLAKAILPL
ncbi:glycosyltransferase family 2 protein [Candidatus Parcubacteria bacterium]|nr:glycosyltransferase family 2 protein [Candidatus Parcubacteria bacterium]